MPKNSSCCLNIFNQEKNRLGCFLESFSLSFLTSQPQTDSLTAGLTSGWQHMAGRVKVQECKLEWIVHTGVRIHGGWWSGSWQLHTFWLPPGFFGFQIPSILPYKWKWRFTWQITSLFSWDWIGSLLPILTWMQEGICLNVFSLLSHMPVTLHKASQWWQFQSDLIFPGMDIINLMDKRTPKHNHIREFLFHMGPLACKMKHVFPSGVFNVKSISIELVIPSSTGKRHHVYLPYIELEFCNTTELGLKWKGGQDYMFAYTPDLGDFSTGLIPVLFIYSFLMLVMRVIQ